MIQLGSAAPIPSSGRAGLWDAYIRTKGVREFHEDLRKRIPVNMELRKQSCGDWEIESRDLNG